MMVQCSRLYELIIHEDILQQIRNTFDSVSVIEGHLYEVCEQIFELLITNSHKQIIDKFPNLKGRFSIEESKDMLSVKIDLRGLNGRVSLYEFVDDLFIFKMPNHDLQVILDTRVMAYDVDQKKDIEACKQCHFIDKPSFGRTPITLLSFTFDTLYELFLEALDNNDDGHKPDHSPIKTTKKDYSWVDKFCNGSEYVSHSPTDPLMEEIEQRLLLSKRDDGTV